jgi:SAM-dependent methyltransferase
MSEQQEDLLQVYYRDYYRFPGRSRWMEEIWSAAFGDNYPTGLDHYGYLTRHDLEIFASRLQLPAGSTLLDIGCGKGGPGLWLAQRNKLQLIGLDIVPEAVQQATAFQRSFQLDYPAQFGIGEFYAIPLADQSVDAVVCIDSLWAAPDKIEALREIHRVMKPGARAVFTYWDLSALEAVPYFEMSGLTFVERLETPDWKAYQQKVYEGILAHEAELAEEMGEGSNMLLYEARASPPYLDMSIRRIYEMERR